MSLLIVIVGLLVSAAGVLLAWFQRGVGTWATFAFGFLLVLVGGPLNTRLGTLSVSGTGVEVSFNAAIVSDTEQESLSARATTALLSLSPAPDAEKSPAKVLLGNASKAFQEDLSNYMVSLGFLPIQPIGAEVMQPGTVLRFDEGRPVVWASSSEAFPNLQVTESSVAIPHLSFLSTTEDKRVEVAFRCATGSKVSEASLLALGGSIHADAAKALADMTDLRVVQSTLWCGGFMLSALLTEGGSDPLSNEDSIRYGEDARVVLGVKLASIAPPRP